MEPLRRRLSLRGRKRQLAVGRGKGGEYQGEGKSEAGSQA